MAVLSLSAAACGDIPSATSGFPTDSLQGPRLAADQASLQSALHCPERFYDPLRGPVLIVHGMLVNDIESFSWGYVPSLQAEGFDVCTIASPMRSTDDFQQSAEYLVYAIRELNNRSGRRVHILTQSVGGLQARWALRWWPDLPARVEDLVMLGAQNHGVPLADVACGTFGRCPQAAWQVRPDSNFLHTLNADSEVIPGLATTSIYSQFDESVLPASAEETSALKGAANILVQDVCAARPVDHLSIGGDGAVFIMVLDAFTHSGPTDLNRLGTEPCRHGLIPGANPLAIPFDEELASLLVSLQRFGEQKSAAFVDAEPAIAGYARP